VRNAEPRDIDAIVLLSQRVYGADFGYTPEMVTGHLSHFAEGQYVAEYDKRIVGYCATFRIAGALALKPHTWREITGGGYAARHDPRGEWLYGMEVCVHPDVRGIRIGQRLYDARKRVCMKLGLAGIVFGGRLPGLGRRIKRFGGVDAYLEAVAAGRAHDPTLSFQLRNGFELVGALPGFLPGDQESLGWASHLVWRNPKISASAVVRDAAARGRLPESVRIATVQYNQRRIRTFEEFAGQVEYFVSVVSDYRADFVLFPELFTLQLLSMSDQPLSATESVDVLSEHTARLKQLFSDLAVRYNVNIIAGSHPTRVDAEVRNVCYVALRDGSLHASEKIHPTPSERNWWGITGGDTAPVVFTDCGPIGVMICYDSEFPELARHLVDQGAMILFVPFCTDERQAYLRVRYSCHARAVENQSYVVMSGNVGNLPGVQNMAIQYAQSCILTPCDFLFARDGVAADTTPNTEMVAFADLRLDDLVQARNSGTVTNLRDRRFDLYQTGWRVQRPAQQKAG
jgi:predicted amidohydrolase/GNAT superfamily N-acetyltransferase